MRDLLVLKPKETASIPWGWVNIGGWVVKPRGEVVVPELTRYFDWKGKWEATSIKELQVDGETYMGTTSMMSVFTTAVRFLGFEEALVRLETGELEEDLNDIAYEMYAWNVSMLEYWPLDGFPDIAIQGDEIGTSHGMMISPDTYRKYLKKHHQEMVDLYKFYGIPIWYHSDGDISEVVADIEEIGYTGIYYEDIGNMKETMERSSIGMVEVVR